MHSSLYLELDDTSFAKKGKQHPKKFYDDSDDYPKGKGKKPKKDYSKERERKRDYET